jgi:hypothetical protein
VLGNLSDRIPSVYGKGEASLQVLLGGNSFSPCSQASSPEIKSLWVPEIRGCIIYYLVVDNDEGILNSILDTLKHVCYDVNVHGRGRTIELTITAIG